VIEGVHTYVVCLKHTCIRDKSIMAYVHRCSSAYQHTHIYITAFDYSSLMLSRKSAETEEERGSDLIEGMH